jgi:hypothetical protein
MDKNAAFAFIENIDYPSFNTVYLPTVPSCWEFGIQRQPRALVPILDSLTPYKFLRGVQFDTKVFQLSELLTILGSGQTPVTEILFHPIQEIQKLKEALTNFQTIFNAKVKGNYPALGFNITELKLTGVDEAFDTYIKILDLLAYDIRIVPNWQDTMPPITISHDWGAGDDFITSAFNAASNILSNAQNMIRSVGSPATSIPYVRDRYKSSKMSEITIPVLLFTKDNFPRDIFLPLMALLSMSSAQSDESVIGAVNRCMLSISGLLEEKYKEFVKEGGKIQTVAELFMAASDAIKASVGVESKTVLPPPVFQITSTDKTINMARGVIQQVSYQFKGPYIKAGYKGLFGQILGSVGTDDIGASVDRLLRDEYVKIFGFKKDAFPSICEISITIRETAFIDGDQYYKKIIAEKVVDIINSGVEQTNFSTMVAAGIAQNIGVVLPETRGTGDLLGGGKWVPPGESLTGIPGFL